jgi:hypothetical protein
MNLKQFKAGIRILSANKLVLDYAWGKHMKNTMRLVMLVLVSAFLLFTSSGCFAIMQWQRQYLGDSMMQFHPDGKESELNQHIYPRREGSSGGESGAGGGCGC